MADSKGTLETLQTLIQTCRNGQNGYMHAAGKAKDSELKAFFDEQSRERGRFAVELTDEAQKLGKVEPSRAGTVAGVLHRAWFELKADIGTGDAGILRRGHGQPSHVTGVYRGYTVPGTFYPTATRKP